MEDLELTKFNNKYKALLTHWKNGHCTMNQILEVIDILDKLEKEMEQALNDYKD